MKKCCSGLLALVSFLALELRAFADIPPIFPEPEPTPAPGGFALVGRSSVLVIAIVLVAAAIVLWALLRRRRK